MPKAPFVPEFLVGYIHCLTNQLRALTHRLQSQAEYTANELSNVQRDILAIDLELRNHQGFVDHEKVQPKVREFRRLYELAEAAWRERQIANVTTQPTEVAPTSVERTDSETAEAPITQPVDLTPATTSSNNEEQGAVAMEVDVGEPPEEAIVINEPDASASGLRTGSQESGQEDTSGAAAAELDLFASDDESELPLEIMSTISTPSEYRPITFEEAAERVQPEPSRDLPARVELAAGPNPFRRSSDTSSRQSNTSGSSYASARQESFSAPMSGIPMPPMCRTCPVMLERRNPDIIGTSERFVHPPTRSNQCPICKGNHRMYRCTTMLRTSLQQRWFFALRAGVCLNCLIHGHSSFRCRDPGSCARCGQRHNSILCPRNPNNQDDLN